MKPILRAVALCAAACFGAASPASAQVFGTFASADILPINAHQVGFYLQASDRTLSGLAQLRLSMYPGLDFGFQGGLARVSWEGNDIVTLRSQILCRVESDAVSATGHVGEIPYSS